MSSSYNIEPPTHGKVVLKTTYGDLDIELWPKQAPLACRNFCQLIMEGYYNGSTFHRVIRNFMFQGGDPSGTGRNNSEDTVYGRLFKDEFHSRLKFRHRGLVGCANENRPDSNGNMFFVTLDRAEHLNKTATIFGRVCGDTVHNLSRFNEVDTDADDRPEDPVYIKEAVVLIPPMDDIVPREKGKGGVVLEPVVKKSKVKNAALMSFDDEDFEDESFAVRTRRVHESAGQGEGKSGEIDAVAKVKAAIREKNEREVANEVLLDYGDEGRQAGEVGVESPAEQEAMAGHDNNHAEKEDGEFHDEEKALGVEYSAGKKKEGGKDPGEQRTGSGKPKGGVSLVDVSRRRYLDQQTKFSSKRKKEQDTLARVKQFRSTLGKKSNNFGFSRVEETEKKKTDDERPTDASVLRRLDDILHQV
jgi:peptidyl-prolyl cis-trans isomerase SDCCAG10